MVKDMRITKSSNRLRKKMKIHLKLLIMEWFIDGGRILRINT